MKTNLEQVLSQVTDTLHQINLPYQLGWEENDDFSSRIELTQFYIDNGQLSQVSTQLKKLTPEISRQPTDIQYKVDHTNNITTIDQVKTEVELAFRNLESYAQTLPECSDIVMRRYVAEEKGTQFSDEYLTGKAAAINTKARELRETLIGNRNQVQYQTAQEFLVLSEEVRDLNLHLTDNYSPARKEELTQTWNGIVDLVGDTIGRFYQTAHPENVVAYATVDGGIKTIITKENRKIAA